MILAMQAGQTPEYFGEVAVLVDGLRDAGGHYVPFEADGLSSGLYFYRLTAGSAMETRAMLLISHGE